MSPTFFLPSRNVFWPFSPLQAGTPKSPPFRKGGGHYAPHPPVVKTLKSLFGYLFIFLCEPITILWLNQYTLYAFYLLTILLFIKFFCYKERVVSLFTKYCKCRIYAFVSNLTILRILVILSRISLSQILLQPSHNHTLPLALSGLSKLKRSII